MTMNLKVKFQSHELEEVDKNSSGEHLSAELKTSAKAGDLVVVRTGPRRK